MEATGEAGESLIQQCSNCDSCSARCWCLDCNEAMCDDCVSAHRRVTVTRSHRLINQLPQDQIHGDLSWTEPGHLQLPSGNIWSSPTKFCRLHPSEPLQLFCFTCSLLTCRDCQLMTHMNHRFQFASEAQATLKRQLEACALPIRTQRDTVRRSLRDMSNRLTQIDRSNTHLKTQLQKIYLTLAQLLRMRVENMVKEIEKVHELECERINQRMVKLKQLQQTHTSLTETAEKARNTSDLSTLLTYTTQMKSQLKDLLLQDLSPPPTMAHLKIITNKKTLETISHFGDLSVSWVPFNVPQTSSENIEAPPPPSAASSTPAGIAPIPLYRPRLQPLTTNHITSPVPDTTFQKSNLSPSPLSSNPSSAFHGPTCRPSPLTATCSDADSPVGVPVSSGSSSDFPPSSSSQLWELHFRQKPKRRRKEVSSSSWPTCSSTSSSTGSTSSSITPTCSMSSSILQMMTSSNAVSPQVENLPPSSSDFIKFSSSVSPPTCPPPTYSSPTLPPPTLPPPTLPSPTLPSPTLLPPTCPSPTLPPPTLPSPTLPSPTLLPPTCPSPTLPPPIRPSPTLPPPTHPSPILPSPTLPSLTRPSPTLPSLTLPSPTCPSPTHPSPTLPSPTLPPPTLPPPTRPPPTLQPPTLLSPTRPPPTLPPPTLPSPTLPSPTLPPPTLLPPTCPSPTLPPPIRPSPTLPPPTRLSPTLPSPTLPSPTRPPPTRPSPTCPSPTLPPPIRPSPTLPPPTRLSPTLPSPTRPPPTRPSPTCPSPTLPSPTLPPPTRPSPTLPSPTLPPPTRPSPTLPSPTLPPPTLPSPTLPPPTRSPPTHPSPTRPSPTLPPPTLLSPTLPPPTLAPPTLAPPALPSPTRSPRTLPSPTLPSRTCSPPTLPSPTLPSPTLPSPTCPPPTLPSPTCPPPTCPPPTLLLPTCPSPTLPSPTLPSPTLPPPTLPSPTLPPPTLAPPTLAPPALPSPTRPPRTLPSPTLPSPTLPSPTLPPPTCPPPTCPPPTLPSPTCPPPTCPPPTLPSPTLPPPTRPSPTLPSPPRPSPTLPPTAYLAITCPPPTYLAITCPPPTRPPPICPPPTRRPPTCPAPTYWLNTTRASVVQCVQNVSSVITLPPTVSSTVLKSAQPVLVVNQQGPPVLLTENLLSLPSVVPQFPMMLSDNGLCTALTVQKKTGLMVNMIQNKGSRNQKTLPEPAVGHQSDRHHISPQQSPVVTDQVREEPAEKLAASETSDGDTELSLPETCDGQSEESSHVIERLVRGLRQWQPTVPLVRLPVSLPRSGCPLPIFRLVRGFGEDEVYVQEPNKDSEIESDGDAVDFTKPLSSPESPVFLEILSCAACGSASTSIICSSCGRGYHRHCHVPPVGPDIRSEWLCSLCQDLLDPLDPYSSDRLSSPQMSSLSLQNLRRCESLLLHLKVEGCSRLSESCWSRLQWISERLSCGQLPLYQTAAQVVSDIWPMFEASQDHALDQLQQSFQKKLEETLSSELHHSVLKAPNSRPADDSLSGDSTKDKMMDKGKDEQMLTSKLSQIRKRLRDLLDVKNPPRTKRTKME